MNHPIPNPSSPPPQTFPLAHPPPKSRQYLRLSSRLLLQIQQLSTTTTTSTPRAIPILELYQPSRLGKSVSNARKLHSRDMYLVQSEPYAHLPLPVRRGGAVREEGGRLSSSSSSSSSPSSSFDSSSSASSAVAVAASTMLSPSQTSRTLRVRSRSRSRTRTRTRTWSKSTSADEESQNHVKRGEGVEEEDQYQDMNERREEGEEEKVCSDPVAIIYTSPKGSAGDVPGAELYFPGLRTTWEASVSPSGRYRFQRRERKGLVVEWERRPPRSAGSGSGSGSGEEDETEEDRFVLGIADPRAQRRPWLAQLTRRGVQVGGWDRWQREQLWLAIDEGAALYTWILTMGVWVARQEGWVK